MMQCPGCVEIRTGMYGEIMSLQSDIHEKVVENPSMELWWLLGKPIGVTDITDLNVS